MTMFRLLFAGMLLSGIACDNKDTTADDDTGTDTDSDTVVDGSTDSHDSGCSEDGVSPCIEEVEAWCYEDTGYVTGRVYFWSASVFAEDPQGDDTVTKANVTVTKDGSIVHEFQTSCHNNVCSERWNANTTSSTMTCSESSARQHTFTFVVVDEDGNASAATTTAAYFGFL